MVTACSTKTCTPRLLKGVAIFAIIFGAVTLFSGGKVLFGPDSARAAVGDYIPFVVWFNFLVGFAYVAAGAGLLMGKKWAAWLARGIALSTLIVILAFAYTVSQGTPYEDRTVGALAFRFLSWVFIACVARANLLATDD